MKKSEMEAHNAEYHARMSAAQVAESKGLYRVAVDAAISAWEFIDGMIQYEIKYGNKDIASIWAIVFVLEYAPLLLDFRSLDKLEHLLAERKRIERVTSEDQSASVDRSRLHIRENHRLWSYLEINGQVQQDALPNALGGEQVYWRNVVEAWEKMGLVQRAKEGRSYRIELATRLGQVIPAKCPACGEIAEAPKAMLLTKTRCPKCRVSVFFVLRQSSVQVV